MAKHIMSKYLLYSNLGEALSVLSFPLSLAFSLSLSLITSFTHSVRTQWCWRCVVIIHVLAVGGKGLVTAPSSSLLTLYILLTSGRQFGDLLDAYWASTAHEDVPSCSTRGEVFVSNNKPYLRVQQEDTSSCSTRRLVFLPNKFRCLPAQQGEMPSLLNKKISSC